MLTIIPAAAFLVLAMYLSGGKGLLLIIGDRGPGLPVRIGDEITLRYTQSMYGVPVEERMTVGDGYLVLHEVRSTDAALEYLGIERHGEGNVRRIIGGFSVPAGSSGGHSVRLQGSMTREMPLAERNAGGGSVVIRIARVSRLEIFLRKGDE